MWTDGRKVALKVRCLVELMEVPLVENLASHWAVLKG